MPAIPSTAKPFLLWKDFTAFSVLVPKILSTDYLLGKTDIKSNKLDLTEDDIAFIKNVKSNLINRLKQFTK